MTATRPVLTMNGPAVYTIRVQGFIGERWLPWLGGLSIEHLSEPVECTLLSGTIPDQAALIGILQQLYTLRLPILLVECQGPAA